MRSTQWIWVLTMYCILHTNTFVESRKVKQEKDIEIISKISSRQEERRKMIIDQSIGTNGNENTAAPHSKQKEKPKGKKKYSFQGKNSYESEESIKDKKNYKRKNKKEEKPDSKKKIRTNFKRREENEDSYSGEEFVKKEKKLKSAKNVKKSIDTSPEFSSIRFKRRSIVNEKEDRNTENKGSRFHYTKEKNMKQLNKDANKLKAPQEIRLPQNDTDVSNRKGEYNKDLIDHRRKNGGYCNNYIVQVNGCDDDYSDATQNLNGETEEKEIVGSKKVKYSIKFAHEKMSKKQKNKETENILKLHRKAESNHNTVKVLKTTDKFLDTDEDSSEEVLPKRKLNLYEDEEG